MLSDDQMQTVKNALFTDDSLHIYAVVDGAACPELRFQIHEFKPQSTCLWSGKLAPDIEEVAPYLVLLERDSELTDWMLKNGCANFWNIFVASSLVLKDMRKQIRKLLLVRSPSGKSMVFRFFDPRVLETFLPLCDEAQLQMFFSGIQKVLAVSEHSPTLIESKMKTVDKVNRLHQVSINI
ncbi:DUF4123 domain-containing protein [Ningiella sp. W23]|uniref:DUF4123 domain-containing protein n=1 Tax=Ningiella sp. W23 TaxID=3023715 RepID=UPI0037580EEB